LVNLNH